MKGALLRLAVILDQSLWRRYKISMKDTDVSYPTHQSCVKAMSTHVTSNLFKLAVLQTIVPFPKNLYLQNMGIVEVEESMR